MHIRTLVLQSQCWRAVINALRTLTCAEVLVSHCAFSVDMHRSRVGFGRCLHQFLATKNIYPGLSCERFQNVLCAESWESLAETSKERRLWQAREVRLAAALPCIAGPSNAKVVLTDTLLAYRSEYARELAIWWNFLHSLNNLVTNRLSFRRIGLAECCRLQGRLIPADLQEALIVHQHWRSELMF